MEVPVTNKANRCFREILRHCDYNARRNQRIILLLARILLVIASAIKTNQPCSHAT